MKNKLLIVYKILLPACFYLNVCQAQILVTDATNDGSVATDFSNAETVTTAGSGIGYQASNGGIFNHYGPAVATLTVNGVYDAYSLTPGSPGIDNFNGLDNTGSAAEITGSTSPLFGILNVTNGSSNILAITNTAGIRIGSTANFGNGITTTVRSNTNTGAIHFLNDASYSGSVNNILTAANADAQHINGYVGKIGNQSFIFPVGSGTDARPLQMSAPGTAIQEYDVAWIDGDPGATPDPSDANATHSVSALGSGINSVSTLGQWDWIPVSGDGNGLTITVSIPSLTAFAATADLRLVGWNGAQWIDLSTATGSGSASGNEENNTLTGVMQTGITAIGIGSSSVPLSLNLLKFTGTEQNCAIYLDWFTADEKGIDHFNIQYSTDGLHFVALAKIVGSNVNNDSYTFRHDTPQNGKNFYRLQMVDNERYYNYSPVIIVVHSCEAPAIIVYPNPLKNKVTIRSLQGNESVLVYNMSGKRVVNITGATGEKVIDLSSHPDGIYNLIILDSKLQKLLETKIVKHQ